MAVLHIFILKVVMFSLEHKNFIVNFSRDISYQKTKIFVVYIFCKVTNYTLSAHSQI